ncbi:MAG: class I SAM-dependent methyltransferase [Nitrospirota bacterium]|nr:class I SAM-dependent methyltransferase [Nitrospirota bacterium]
MSTNQPDWQRIAEKFDYWLPYIAPVGEILIESVAVRPGDRLLDVACGTGEPGLTVARRLGSQVQVTLTDAAEGMIGAARKKAQREGLDNVQFSAMPAHELNFPDCTFDRVLCRFGVMFFPDPVVGLGKIWRVLKPGGRFALAVWAGADRMPLMRISAEVINPLLPPDTPKVALAQVTSLGAEGVLDAALQAAGFSNFTISHHELEYIFPSFDAYWDLTESSEIIKQQMDALTPEQQAMVRDEVANLARAYHTKDGTLVLPHTYIVASGTR